MMRASLLPVLAATGLILTGCQETAAAAENHLKAPEPALIAKETGGLKTAIFAGGCFWGVEGVFSHVKGVRSAVSGYHGGTKRQADYKLVSSGITDHVEAVKITYDPEIVRYDELVRIFFSVVADPTLKNRQGPDRGAHYDATLVPLNAVQRKVASSYLSQMKRSDKWSRPIVTGVSAPKTFYPAEGYHQDYMLKNPRSGYIVRWDAPKVRALAQYYPEHYRSSFQRN